MKLTIDFETRSRVELKTVGTYAYAEHPSTEIICMAAACEGEEPRVWMPDALAAKLPPGHSLPLCSVQDILSAPGITEIEAHNAIFEYAIWTRCAQAKYGFPALNPDSVSCSMALACTYALPASLDGAGAALGLPIQKDKDGQRLMLKMCKPNSRTWEWHEDPHDLERLARYCMQDVRAEQALSKALGGELLPKERRLWQLTLKMNDRGVMLDVPLVHAANKIVGDHTARLLARTAELTSGVVASPKQVAALGNWVNLRCGKPVLKSADKAAVAEALARTDLPADVREVLEIRQSLGKSSTAKYQAMLDMACSDGRLRDNMVFHKASTGRYAGKGVQLQNFPRPPKGFDPAWALTLLGTGSASFIAEMGEDPMWLASGALRSMIVPGPGNDLIVADYASVEARNVLWAAGEKEAVRLFVEGGDIYCEMASSIYGRPVTKKDKPERQLGKTAILGCGYGMGAPKFLKTCLTQGLEIDATMAQRAVDAYRAKYPGVPKFWWAQELAFKQAVKKPGHWFPAKIAHWMFRNRFLRCKLPSGRCLWYLDPVVANVDGRDQLTYMGVNSYTRKWERQTTFGGKLTENIISAISRDIMAEALPVLEEAGYPVVLTVHDEIIAEVPQGHGSLEEFLEIMTAAPEWAPGCPVGAEGWRNTRYGKG